MEDPWRKMATCIHVNCQVKLRDTNLVNKTKNYLETVNNSFPLPHICLHMCPHVSGGWEKWY